MSKKTTKKKKTTTKKDIEYIHAIQEKPYTSIYEVRLWVAVNGCLWGSGTEEQTKNARARWHEELSEHIEKSFCNHYEFKLLDKDMGLVQMELFPPTPKH